MNIELNDQYRINKDNHNYILQEKKYPDPNSKFTKDPNAYRWIDVGYYGKLKHLVDGLIEREVKTSTVEDIRDIVHLVETVKEEIFQRLEGIK